MKLIIIEDEEALRRPVRRYLEANHFEVDEAIDGEQGIELVRINQYDCIILDLNLPVIDGMEVSKRIREDGNTTPIIMVTARSQVYDKLEGFNNGADDYITKPFDLKELVARINAVIKRSSANKESVLKFAHFTIDIGVNIVIDNENGVEYSLSNKEVEVLEYLLRNRNRIVSAEELLEHVWGTNIDSFSDTVKTHIKTLRKKIDPEKKYILTYRGKGYQIK